IHYQQLDLMYIIQQLFSFQVGVKELLPAAFDRFMMLTEYFRNSFNYTMENTQDTNEQSCLKKLQNFLAPRFPVLFLFALPANSLSFILLKLYVQQYKCHNISKYRQAIHDIFYITYLYGVHQQLISDNIKHE